MNAISLLESFSASDEVTNFGETLLLEPFLWQSKIYNFSIPRISIIYTKFPWICSIIKGDSFEKQISVENVKMLIVLHVLYSV